MYGAPEALIELVQRLTTTIIGMGIGYEIVLVDDACPKGSWRVIEKLIATSENLIGIRFSRNFGQHMAIFAGLKRSRGKYVVVMDCDLQDRPEEIPKLYNALTEECWYVVAHRTERNDFHLKRFSSWAFHKILSYLTGTESNAGVANFGIYKRKVIDSYLQIKERTRSFQLHLLWLGYNHSMVEVKHSERPSGRSSYTFAKLLHYAFDLILCFSDKPIRLAISAGSFTALGSFFLALFFAIRWFSFGSSVEGWTSLIVSIWFLAGINMMLVGVVGLYVAKTFDECKKRPLYVVDKEIDASGKIS